jgi:hypothetical protein
MNKRLTIQQVNLLNQSEILLEIDRNEPLNGLSATGQMLVDSAGSAFVYLLENDDSYTYIIIPEENWVDLKTASKEPIAVYLTNGKEKILLSQFHEELCYLIDNINGNSNYGDEMVAKVEAVFSN